MLCDFCGARVPHAAGACAGEIQRGSVLPQQRVIPASEDEYPPHPDRVATRAGVASAGPGRLDGRGWVRAGYAFALLGGFVGLGIGGMLFTAGVEDDAGRTVRKYSDRCRAHALAILALGGIVMAVLAQLKG